jgi:hypothetical protein
MIIEEQVPDITKKIDAFKEMIDGPYHFGKWDKDILALSLQGVSDEMIKKTIDKKKYLTSDFLKMKKFKIKLSYLKQRKKILFDRFKNEYLENEKQKEIREMNSLVWNKAIRENRVF